MHCTAVREIDLQNDRAFSLFASFYSLFPIPFSQFVISSLKKEGEAERRQTQIQPPRLRAARANPMSAGLNLPLHLFSRIL